MQIRFCKWLTIKPIRDFSKTVYSLGLALK
jgi:hypothetical protein